jgi:hypothetical protein
VGVKGELVVQILRLVPRRLAGQTAGIEPKLLFVAKNGTPQIDVKQSSRIAADVAVARKVAGLPNHASGATS